MSKKGFIQRVLDFFRPPSIIPLLEHNCDDHWLQSPHEWIHGELHARDGQRECSICGRGQYMVYHRYGDKRFEWVDDHKLHLLNYSFIDKPRK